MIRVAQARHSEYANKKRLPTPDIKIGDRVMVSTEWIKLNRPAKKLSEKFIGPYKVLGKPGSLSFTIDLPKDLKIHPVFHPSELEPFTESKIENRVMEPPPPVEVEGAEGPEYELSQIVDSKYDRRYRSCPLRYRVEWLGYEETEEQYSWLGAIELDHSQELVETFHLEYPNKPGSYTEFLGYLP
jgi:hypothetical protein